MAPIMNPPPMNRLTTAVGRITNADRTLKPKSIMTIAPISTNPSMIPRMTPKDPSAASQGRKLLQAAKKPEDRSATPLKKIRAAATPTRAAGIHQNLSGNDGLAYGPYQPGWRTAGNALTKPGAGCVEIGTVWKQLGHRISPLYGLLHDAHVLRPQRLQTAKAGRFG